MDMIKHSFYNSKLVLFLILLCMSVFLTVPWTSKYFTWRGFFHAEPVLNIQTVDLSLKCHNVLDKMLTGYWVKHQHAQEEVHKLLQPTREKIGLPSMQRKDKRCGNINFVGKKWFRAVCDPEGEEPCCYNNTCVSLSEEACRCPDCFDLRQRLHAELATWVPVDPDCKIIHFSGEEDTCKVLQNITTVVLMGDSIMRGIYDDLMSLLRINKKEKLYKSPVTKARKDRCMKRPWAPENGDCIEVILHNSTECNDTVTVRFVYRIKTQHKSDIIRVLRDLSGKPNSVLFFGFGIHDSFQTSLLKKRLFNPIFKELSKSPWPRPIWMSMHSIGLLKTPLNLPQNTESIERFNAEINAMMRKRGIPVLDFYNMTRKVFSIDGVHYGKGVNLLKVEIFLNYLLELRLTSPLFSFHK